MSELIFSKKFCNFLYYKSLNSLLNISSELHTYAEEKSKAMTALFTEIDYIEQNPDAMFAFNDLADGMRKNPKNSRIRSV